MTGDASDGEWPGQFLSAQTIAYSCGILARRQDGVVHAHDPEELKRCQRLAGDAARIMQGIYVGMSDEGDHTLDPFFIPANVPPEASLPGKREESCPKVLTEAFFRAAMRGTIYPSAVLTIEPFARTSSWWQAVSKVSANSPNDPDEQKRVAQWGRLIDWFQGQTELHSPVHIAFAETGDESFAAVVPKFFVGLTNAGSVVGLATCMVCT
jgi:hypothetical protein